MPRDPSVYLEDNVLIHAYFGVDLDIVWDIVTTKVPGLMQRVKALLGPG
jgi:uncharacterized protein with HEPN domain